MFPCFLYDIIIMNDYDYNRGRRHFITNDEHKKWNFLTHYGYNNNISFKDEPSLNKCKFGKGFKRKPLQQIWPNYEENRVNKIKIAIQKREKHFKKRQEFLKKISKSNGNILTGDIPINKTRHIFSIKKKPNYDANTFNRDKLIRDKISNNRFFSEKLKNRPMIKKIKYEPKKYSSTFILGKKDIQSNGVLDAFIGHGLNDKEVQIKSYQ